MEHKAESTWANKRKEEQELGSKAFMIKSPHLPNRMLCRGCEKSWAILSLYPSISRREREEGSPCFGKYLRFPHFQISSVSREVRCWSPLLSRNFRFGKPLISGEVRVEGRNRSSGNLSFLHPSIPNVLRKWSVCKPHSIRLATSLLQFLMWSSDKLVGKPPSGNESISGQLSHLATKLN